MRRAATVLILSLAGSVSFAIQAPKKTPEPTARPATVEPAEPTRVTASDETTLFSQIERVALKQMLRDVTVSPQILQQLRSNDIESAVDALGKLANGGDEQANVALLRIQRYCASTEGAAENAGKEQLQKPFTDLPAERAGRVLGVMRASGVAAKVTVDHCRRAKFDTQAIQNRLRQAATAGKPASATELARYSNDPQQRRGLLEAAAAQNYLPGTYALAADRLYAVQRGDTTQNVSSIRSLLKQAARQYPAAKIHLANCMALGCDGHPAEPANAAVFGIDAAKDGEPTAYVSMAHMPWGVQLTREQLLAWQYFGDRLNEAGCFGESYDHAVVQFVNTIALAEKNQQPETIKRGHEIADQYWSDFSARAKHEQGCE